MATAKTARSAAAPAARRTRGTLSHQDAPSGFGEAYFSIWHRIGRASLYAVAAVVPWLALPATGVAATSAKLAFTALACAVGLVALLADTIERRKLTYPGSWASLAVLAVVLATAASAIFSQAPALSTWGALLMPDSLVATCAAALLFVLSAVFITHRVDVERLAAAFLSGVSAAAFFGILDMLGVPHLAGLSVAGSLPALGFLCVLALGICAAVPWGELQLFGKAVVAKTLALCLAALLLINFASLWVGLALVALGAAAVAFSRKVTVRLPLALAVVALALTLVGPHLPAVGVPRGDVRPSFSASLAPAKAVLSTASAAVGEGAATYVYSFAQHRTDVLNAGPFWGARFSQAASFAATVPVTLGIAGSLAWLALALAAVELARRKSGNLVNMVAGIGAGLSVLAALAFPLSFVQLATGAVLLGVLLGWSGGRRTFAFAGPATWRLLAAFAVLAAVAAATLSGTFLLGEKFVAGFHGGAGYRALAAGDADAALAAFARAASLDGSSDAYVRGLSQAQLLKVQQLSSGSGASAQAEAALSAALESANAAVSMNPADVTNWSHLGGVYEGLSAGLESAGEMALQAYAEAASRDPQDPSWHMARARVHGVLAGLQKGAGSSPDDSYRLAQEEVEAALKLKPNYVDVRFVSASLLLAQGNVEAALSRVREVRELAPFDAGMAYQLGLLLSQGGQAEFAHQEFSRAVELNPEYADARYFLGLSFAGRGETDRALEQFRWIAERNPDSAEVGKIVANLEAGRPALDGVAQQPAAPAQPEAVPAPAE